METETQTSAYIWFDAEYTDLDLDRARLLQVAAIATDVHLNRLLPPDQDFIAFVRLPATADAVSPWVREHLAEVVTTCQSDRAVDVDEVDKLLVQWLGRAVPSAAGHKSSRPVLAGNSIHADWFLARKYLPEFMRCLHYRLFDVTTLKLLWQDWMGRPKFDKENAALVRQYFPGAGAAVAGQRHDAYYDVQASIAELAFYRVSMLGRPSEHPQA